MGKTFQSCNEKSIWSLKVGNKNIKGFKRGRDQLCVVSKLKVGFARIKQSQSQTGPILMPVKVHRKSNLEIGLHSKMKNLIGSAELQWKSSLFPQLFVVEYNLS